MKNKILFDLVDNIGEGLFLSLHIIDITEFGQKEKYRVYHLDGYCFNIEKKENEFYNEKNLDEFGGFYEYSFQADLFDGFKTLTVNEAIKLIKKYK